MRIEEVVFPPLFSNIADKSNSVQKLVEDTKRYAAATSESIPHLLGEQMLYRASVGSVGDKSNRSGTRQRCCMHKERTAS